MLTLRLLTCATLLTGCDIVFSVDEVRGPVGHPVEVRGSLHRRTIDNDPSDIPRVSALLPPTMISADVAFADGTKQDVVFGADGEFAFSWPDDSQAYSLTLRSPLTEVLTYQLSSPNPRLVERVGGRANRVAVTPGTLVHVGFPTDPLPGPSTYLEVDSLGIYTRKFLGPTTVTQSFDWSTTAATGPVGLLEAGPDAMVFLEMQPSGSAYQLSRYGIQHQPQLVAGQDNAMPFDLQAPVPNKCVSITVDHAAEIQRLQSIETVGLSIGWYVFAAPAPEFLPELGFPLALRDLGPQASPFSETFMYENPLEGFASYAVFEVGTKGARSAHSLVAVPLDGTCTPVTLPTGVVNIAGQIMVGGTELTTTGESVTIDRSKTVPIDFTPTASGTADYYMISVRDATPAAVTRARILTTEPHATIDPDLLLPARSYVITINSRIGIPNAATGDFETNGTTFASGIATSTTFQVQ